MRQSSKDKKARSELKQLQAEAQHLNRRVDLRPVLPRLKVKEPVSLAALGLTRECADNCLA